jgi:hypothetical protein
MTTPTVNMAQAKLRDFVVFSITARRLLYLQGGSQQDDDDIFDTFGIGPQRQAAKTGSETKTGP